jgi:Mrp family chromosome partitioning ATPase/uncharacterized protein involved in exopolysaccharide biosynthesis
MDLLFIFNVLWRKKWLLLLIAIGTTVSTYFALKLLPPQYLAEAIIATGIVERKGIDLEQENAFVQQFQINSQFSNLRNRLLSRSNLRLIGYRMIEHELTALKKGASSFRSPDEEVWTYNKPEADSVLAILSDEINLLNPSQQQESLLRKIAQAFQYDYEPLSESLVAQRDGDTDYFKIQFTSESPELSVFFVNALCEDFVNRYNIERADGEITAIDFYSTLAQDKKQEIDSLTLAISDYKQQKRIVDLEEEGSFLIAEKKDLQLAKEEQQKNILGLEKAIINLDQYLKEKDLSFTQKDVQSLLLREDIAKLKQEKGALLEQYDLGGRLDESLQADIRKTDEALDIQLSKLAEDRVSKLSKEKKDQELKELFFKRIDTEIDLILAKESVNSLENALKRLEQEAVGYVTDEAVLENLEGEKTIKTDEYLDIVSKLNEAQRIALSDSAPLQIIEYAEFPDKPESSKSKIIALLAGIVAASGLALFLIVLSLLDSRINSLEKLASMTQLPTIGELRTYKDTTKELSQIFEHPTQKVEEQLFREEVRQIRYVIENSGAKKLLFTSLQPNTGKTFLIVALSYSLSVMRKRILIVDTNLKNNALTVMANKVLADNLLFNGLSDVPGNTDTLSRVWQLDDNIHIIGNQGGSYSPSELLAGRNFEAILDKTASQYDYVFLEAPNLNDYTDTKELVVFADKIIAVFEDHSTISAKEKVGVQYLKQLGNKFLGSILNKTVPTND